MMTAKRNSHQFPIHGPSHGLLKRLHASIHSSRRFNQSIKDLGSAPCSRDFADRKSQRFSSVKSSAPTVNLSHTGACEGEKKPSRQPAMTSRGMMPETRRVASMPPRATESFQ